MLSFELAKQLKESGWPQPDTRADIKGEWVWDEWNKNAYAPSLDELIDACPPIGNAASPFCLTKSLHHGWFAGYGLNDFLEQENHGATPSEAVARLWLKLREAK
jgi:hypothetical protein